MDRILEIQYIVKNKLLFCVKQRIMYFYSSYNNVVPTDSHMHKSAADVELVQSFCSNHSLIWISLSMDSVFCDAYLQLDTVYIDLCMDGTLKQYLHNIYNSNWQLIESHVGTFLAKNYWKLRPL